MLAGFGFVSLHVQRQMVAASEASFADLALEGFGASVLPDVAGEFVGSSETPQTVLVSAGVRLLTRVNPLVCFEMRAFCVNFGATWVIAVMNATFFQLWIVSAIVFHDLTSGLSAGSHRLLR